MESSGGNNGRLPSVQKLSFSVGHVYNALCTTMFFTYFLVYLQFVMKIPASLAGGILMAGQLVEAIATPLSGFESDRSLKGCGNLGRRKSTHLFGTILTIFSFPFIFIVLPGFERASPEALFVYFIPLVCIFKIGWASVQISHLSMIPELSADTNDRDDLAILRYVFDMISDMSVYFITWAAFVARSSTESVTIDETDGWRFRDIALILVLIGLVSNGIFHFFTVEKPPQDEMQLAAARKISRSIFDQNVTEPVTEVVSMKWSDWFREKHYFQVGILLVIARLFLNLIQAFLPLFLQEGIEAPQEYLAIIPGVCQLSALLASLLVKIVLHFSTKKVAFITGTCCAFTGCIWLAFDNPEAVRIGNIFPLAALIGAGTGMIIVLSTSFVSDLIGENTESGAYVFGSIAFIHNLLSGISIFLVQIGHGLCEDCPTYYRNVLSYGLSFLAVLSLVIVLLLDPPTLGTRFSDKNTAEGRKTLKDKKWKRKYGSTRHGFAILKQNS